MNKLLSTFLTIFALLFALFAYIDITRFREMDVVAKSPAFVLAKAEGMKEKTKGIDHKYQVNFSYVVDGTPYTKDTEWMTTLAQAEELAASPVEIAYPTSAPAKGVFRSDFDKRDPKASMMGAIMGAVLWSLLMSIVPTLVFLWRDR